MEEISRKGLVTVKFNQPLKVPFEFGPANRRLEETLRPQDIPVDEIFSISLNNPATSKENFEEASRCTKEFVEWTPELLKI